MITSNLPQMKQTLHEIDTIYSSITKYMSVNDRLVYCECLIKETENFLASNVNTMDNAKKEKYQAIITAAREEIATLNNVSNS